MMEMKGSPPRTGERSTAKRPALNNKVQPRVRTLQQPLDQASAFLNAAACLDVAGGNYAPLQAMAASYRARAEAFA